MQLFSQVYKLYAYVIQKQLLVPNHITYDESYRTSSYWIVEIPLFVKLMCGYASSIVCKINLVNIYLTPT